MTACTVIGLGEAGATYAAALVAAGHQVTGFDPVAPSTPAGVIRAATAAEACANADIVLVLTGAAAARAVAQECLPVLPTGSCYADFTSSSPHVMQELGQFPSKALFADVAILGPVPTQGAKTPLMVSGPGSAAVADLLSPLGADVEIADGGPGAAMSHKLLRSVLMKGLASVVVEAVTAGRAAGLEEWIRGQIALQLAGDGQAVIDRFLTGTAKHAQRRSKEMQDTARYLSSDLEVPAEMTTASAAALTRMASEPASALR
ncbi:3-hydroxyisobutyrate dehydrogenase-like beta-hydroxyacid dehydrogenase [Paenarthrobacter nitroguajacolicus]|uniref:NAD(P)-dependent oxidoreductase n=1 Tax=Paenarthrobacter TaxID=1742992 RepID=UPI0028615376|nr:NAD(P)-binding domain-containing protein [Paenarthrobacter nitroguajacolicus]MDR6987550.1 3-hydroxyisobutyrate dehydrogenase-like beta-hydroxyacid dehydrogenase [Paenarthrobacter nitroguajacolicus]